MPQNMISLQLAAADLTAIDGALKTLEDRLTGLIGLSPAERRTSKRLWDCDALSISAVGW